MRIERVDPADVDLATAEEVAAVSRAELAVEAPSAIPPSAEGTLLQARYGHDDHPAEAWWLVRADSGELVGHASLDVTHWDNPELGFVFCTVHPSARGAGVGHLLLDAQVAAARALWRSSLLTFAVQHGHAATFLAANGFVVGQHTAQRRLRPSVSTLTTSRRWPRTPSSGRRTTSWSRWTGLRPKTCCRACPRCSRRSTTHQTMASPGSPTSSLPSDCAAMTGRCRNAASMCTG